MGIHDYTFYDLINRNAVCFRNRPAWFEVDDQRTLTFAEYKTKVDQLACGLQAAGIKKGDRIGAFGKNSLEFFCLYGAAGALGAIVLPINWRLSVEEALFNLNDCDPVMLFVDPEYQQMIGGAKDKLPSVKDYYSLKPPGDGFAAFDALLKNDGAVSGAIGMNVRTGEILVCRAKSVILSAGGTFNFDNGVLTVDGGTFDPGTTGYTVDGASASNNPTRTASGGAPRRAASASTTSGSARAWP